MGQLYVKSEYKANNGLSATIKPEMLNGIGVESRRDIPPEERSIRTYLTLAKFVLLALGSAAMAALGIARYALHTGEDPSDDGPRALIAEFFGYWAGGFFLIWSFFAPGKYLPWTLRGVAAALVLTGIAFSVHFGSITEVPETPDKEPTGFKNDSTDLHLE